MSELAERLLARDTTLWPAGNLSAGRLGWLDVPRTMEAQADDLRRWADSIDQETVVLLGTTACSLGPAALAAVAAATGRGNGRRLILCDSVEPETVASLPSGDTFFLVCSKSGGEPATRALVAYAWSKRAEGRRFAAITDFASPLMAEAQARSFGRTFVNPQDLDGAYSVLSYFGMVTAALVGYDPAELAVLALEVDVEIAAARGEAIANTALEGRDKLNIVAPSDFGSLAAWVEQLVAGSTGKMGRGCIPLPTAAPEPGPDRFEVVLSPESSSALGPEFYSWEIAAALASHVLEVDPFDQPDAADTEAGTEALLEDLPVPRPQAVEVGELKPFLERNVSSGDYVSIQAYLPLGQDHLLEAARRRISVQLEEVATTAGYGPRVLGSTAQLHKGGPKSVVVVQVVPSQGWEDLPIPGFSYDFGAIMAAQVLADHQSLLARGRRVIRVAVNSLDELG